MSAPEVSVVMSVYNGSEYLEQTMASVLSQDDCDLEFIVVDDGSTDDTGRILDEWAARDERLHVIHQQNTGLTRALIRGCAEARGKFIARQDAGDVSLPGRIAAQIQLLDRTPECVAATCHTEFIGPRGEFLYNMRIEEDELNRGLSGLDGEWRGPAHHGSVTMRRAAYETAGGYCAAFYFAQDLDLWSRLIEHGRFAVVEDVRYRARLEPHSISGVQNLEQRRLTKLIAELCAARRAGESTSTLLAEADSVRPIKNTNKARRLAQGNYFIGCCLRTRDPARAKGYFMSAIRGNFFHWRAWIRYFECLGLEGIYRWKMFLLR